MSKREYITIYGCGDMGVEIHRDGTCDKCENKDIPIITFSYDWTTIDLCFGCIQKSKEKLLGEKNVRERKTKNNKTGKTKCTKS